MKQSPARLRVRDVSWVPPHHELSVAATQTQSDNAKGSVEAWIAESTTRRSRRKRHFRDRNQRIRRLLLTNLGGAPSCVRRSVRPLSPGNAVEPCRYRRLTSSSRRSGA